MLLRATASRWIVALALVWGGAQLAAGAPSPPSGQLPFWDSYLQLVERLRSDPAAARAWAENATTADPDDFLGSWLAGAVLARTPADSARARQTIASAQRERRRAGRLVTAGTLLLARGDWARGAAAYQSAAEAYRTHQRPLDAAHALLWPIVLSEERLDPPLMDQLVREAESIARRSGDAAMLADVLHVKAARVIRSDPRGAIAIRREVQTLLQPLGPRFVLLANHRRMGLALSHLGELDEAEAHYVAAAALADTLGLFEAKAYCLSNLGSLQERRGRFDETAQLQQEAVAAAERSGVPSALVMTLTNLAGAHYQLGHCDRARPTYERALEIGQQARLPYRELLPALDSLAGLHRVAGRFDQALSLWQSALDSCRAGHLDDLVSMVQLHMAETHFDVGNLSTARDYSQQGLELARRFPNRAWELYHLVFRADLLSQSDDPEGALQAARQATALARQADPSYLTPAHHVEASALHALHRTGEAIALLDSVIAHFPTPADSSDLAEVVAWQAALTLDDGLAARSVDLYTQALAIERALGAAPLREAGVELGLGRALLAAGRRAPSIAHLEAGLARLESVRDALGLAQERRQFLSAWYEGYVALARAHLQSGHPEQSFAVLERCRANQTRELLGGGSPGLTAQVPAELATQASTVQHELAAAQIAWVRGRALARSSSARSLAALDARLDSLRARWAELSGRIARTAPGWARETGTLPPATAAGLRRWLGPRRRLVAFLVGQQATLAFDITGAGMQVRELPWGERQLAQRVDAFVTALRTGDDAAARDRGAALGDTLLAAGIAAAPAPEQLFVAADGPLHRIPFEALSLRDRHGTSRFVVEICPVAYATSGTLLAGSAAGTADATADGAAAGSTAGAATGRVVAFGDPTLDASASTGRLEGRSFWREALQGLPPLPHARREAASLGAIFEGARVYLGADATEARFFSEAGGARVVHVAAHAFVDDHHPMFSGIVLAPSATGAATALAEDGLVQADEVMQHQLDAELVTLSACETGAGALLRGEGIVGLARAFRVAGAHNLVVSLWKVDDAATATLMQRFYEEIARGSTPAVALRAAKLSLLRGTVGAAAHGEAPSARGVGRQSVAAFKSSLAAWAPFVLFTGPAKEAAATR